MSFFLYADDDDKVQKINIDDLYEKNQRRDMKQVSIFNKILNRIQKRIQFTSKMKRDDKHIWFVVPEYIFGEPVYDKGDCIAYVVSKLEDNGFYIKYVHPNTLFISWENWVPSYVRTELKKKRGIVVDEHGNVVSNKEDDEKEENMDYSLFNDRTKEDPSKGKKEPKQYTPIGTYKPTGNLVYNQELFDKLEKRVVFDLPPTKK
jgi:hypothetical protein